MNAIKGYRTYLSVIVMMIPDIINVVSSGIVSGQAMTVIGFGVLALIFRKLADTAK